MTSKKPYRTATPQEIGLELFMQLEQPNGSPYLPTSCVVLMTYDRIRSTPRNGKSLAVVVGNAVDSVGLAEGDSGQLARFSPERQPELVAELEAVGYRFTEE